MSGGRYFLSVLATFGVVMAIMVGFAPAAYAEDGDEVFADVPEETETVEGGGADEEPQGEGAATPDYSEALDAIALKQDSQTDAISDAIAELQTVNEHLEAIEEITTVAAGTDRAAKDYSDVINKQVAGDFFFIKLADTVLLVLVLGALGWITLSGRD